MQIIGAIYLVTWFSMSMSLPVNNTSKKLEKSDNIMDRTKKLATDYIEALKKIMDSSGNDKNSTEGRCSHIKQGLAAEDLSSYEQMVIMKKYPYLDLKELDKFHPHKNARQSLHSDTGLDFYCESSANNRPNVDITNRGLSGFSIPTKLMVRNDDVPTNNLQAAVKSPTPLLKSLKEDILKFEEYKLRS